MGHLQVTFSNRIDLLLERFSAAIMRPMENKPGHDHDFLAAEYVLLDNKVLGEWLNMQLAEKHGVAANIQYVQPSGLFWNLAKSLCGEQLKEETPLLKEEMKWRLFRLLADSALLVFLLLVVPISVKGRTIEKH